jgi:predicted kinase
MNSFSFRLSFRTFFFIVYKSFDMQHICMAVKVYFRRTRLDFTEEVRVSVRFPGPRNPSSVLSFCVENNSDDSFVLCYYIPQVIPPMPNKSPTVTEFMTSAAEAHLIASSTQEMAACKREPWEGRQIVLVLSGLIGSGKSTFAVELQRHFPQFIRCNQDDLGNRLNVENLARNELRRGMSVCIDRTNFNPPQRAYWIKIAGEFPGTLIWLIVFDTPYETCAARLRERISHPTIKSPEQGLSVLARFANDFQYPEPGEGYNRIVYLGSADQPGLTYSRSEVANILQRLWDSAPVISTRIARPLDTPQGNWTRGSSSSSSRSRIRYQPRGFGNHMPRRGRARHSRSTHDPHDSRV